MYSLFWSNFILINTLQLVLILTLKRGAKKTKNINDSLFWSNYNN